MAQKYWGANYWNANYWGDTYWADPVVVDPQWWNDNYWNSNYWNTNYWAQDDSGTVIEQVAAQQLALTPFIQNVNITYQAFPATSALALTGLQAQAANNAEVSASVGTKTLTANNAFTDTSDIIIGDINVAVYAASVFGFTDSVAAGLASRTLSGNQAAIQEGQNVTVSITSTPALSLAAFSSEATNPVQVFTPTASLAVTEYAALTGLGVVVNSGVQPSVITPRQANIIGTPFGIISIDINLPQATLTGYSVGIDGISVENVAEVYIFAMQQNDMMIVPSRDNEALVI